jgi:N-acetylneuraminic acid mutarotase
MKSLAGGRWLWFEFDGGCAMNRAGKMRKTSLAGAILFVLMFVLANNAQAQGGSWLGTGSMRFARAGHTATLLNDGRALVAGGDSDLEPGGMASAELYDPGTGTWTETGSMSFPRSGHTATLLNDGRVLVAGGDGASGVRAELYDPATGTWTETGSMTFPRSAHTATLLNDGKVLVAAGFLRTTSELYDPAVGTWTQVSQMRSSHYGHTATLLNNGKVLVAGAFVTGWRTELYDPATGTWTDTDNMQVGRSYHTATLLDGGEVLVTGGCVWSPNPGFGPPGCFASNTAAELYDPMAGTWTITGFMGDARRLHTATRLTSGRVLVTGSLVAPDAGYWPQLNTAEEYDRASGSWVSRTFMGIGRSGHTATLMNDGRVLVAGGYDGFVCDFDEFIGRFYCNAFYTAAAEVSTSAP